MVSKASSPCRVAPSGIESTPPVIKTKSSRELLVRKTDFSYETTEDTSIQEVFATLVPDEQHRNKLICEDVLDAMARGRRCLILSQRREHCRILDQLFRERDRTPLVVDGSLGKKARDKILLAIILG